MHKIKSIIFFILIVLLSVMVACQEKSQSPATKKTISQTRDIKNDKLEELEFGGPDKYVKLHHQIRTRTGDTKPRYTTNYKQVALQKSIRTRAKMGIPRNSSLDWQERGPANVAGRTRGILVDKRDTSHLTWLVGAASGGIWKTTDGGNNWALKTAGIANLGTTTLAASDANPDIIYAGTGEGFSHLFVQGDGMYKSLDGGESWAVIPSTQKNPKFENILRIVVDPQNPNIVLAATRRSLNKASDLQVINGHIMKSTDGGNTWTVVYFITGRDERISIINNMPAVQQIVADPTNFNILYATVRGTGVLKSMDKGDTWSLIFDVNKRNAPFGRIELAVSPVNPNIIHFAAEETDRITTTLMRSSDGGNNWIRVRGDFGNWLSSQGWYNNTIAAHPYDQNTVWVGGTIALLSITSTGFGESNFSPITRGGRIKGVHVDHHNIILIPVDETTQNFYVINANDGGIAFSKDAGQTFLQTGDTFKESISFSGPNEGEAITFPTALGYNTSQFYGVDKMNGANRYIGGTQDNGSWLSPEHPDETSNWRPLIFGDGMEAAWNYGNPDLVLFSSFSNLIARSEDNGNTWTRLSSAAPGRGPFLTQIESSKQDPDLVFLVSDLGVLKSTDFGLSWTVTRMPEEWQFSNIRTPIALSLASPEVVWTRKVFDEKVGLMVSTDGGDSFQPTNGYNQATLGTITEIATHPTNRNKAYALFSIADGPKILATDDLGQSWRDISGFETNQQESTNGFPDVATFTLLVMPFDTNQIWVGTEVGLFESLDGGASWHYADNGLPPVMIYEMKIVNDEVILATFGRGIWTVSLPELEGYEPLPTPIAPLVDVGNNGLNGQVTGSVNLRSVYDSTIIEIFLPNENEAPTLIGKKVLAGNLEETILPFDIQTNINLTTDTIIVTRVKVSAYHNGQVLDNYGDAFIYTVDEDIVTNYRNNFDESKSDFATLAFTVFQAEGFDDKALHSPHPYNKTPQSMAVFQKPILVDESTSLLTFDELVLVETGTSEEFGDLSFGDYVTIEATKNKGQTWITLDGYDSRRHLEWGLTYNFEFPITPELIKNHQVNLSDFFEEGDVIYLRFRLVSDLLNTALDGWGWMIDNFELNSTLTTVKELRESIALKNYPNPFTHSTILEYELSQKSKVQAALYSLDGKLIRNLIQATLPAGKYQQQVNTSGLMSGMYICRFTVDGVEKVFKWVKN